MQKYFSKYLKEIVYGGNDGIVTTFAVVAGFTGAKIADESLVELSFLAVLLFGLANLFADGVSMGLGNYLSEKSAQDKYKSLKQEQLHQIESHTKNLEKETATILLKNGIKGQNAKTVLLMFRKHKDFWVDFLLNYKLKETSTANTNPKASGITTLISFITFGFIPLVPFFIFKDSPNAFYYSMAGTMFALLLLGTFRAGIVGKNKIRSILEVIVIGTTASSVAFFIGTVFS